MSVERSCIRVHPDGRVVAHDGHDRSAAACLEHASLAEAHATALRRILSARPIPLDHFVGPRLAARLEAAADTCDQLAARDHALATNLAALDRRYTAAPDTTLGPA